MEKTIQSLGEQLRSQIESVVDMCDDCLDEVKVAIAATETPSLKPVEIDDEQNIDASEVCILYQTTHVRVACARACARNTED